MRPFAYFLNLLLLQVLLFCLPCFAQNQTIYTLNGVSPADKLGSGVAAIGDLNNDGRADFVVGNPGQQRVTVFSGHNGSTVIFTNTAGTTDFAKRVALAGDVNGDGIKDYMASGPNEPGGGIVKVYSGANGNELCTFSGASVDLFGDAIATAGDVNADGRDEILIGSPGATSTAGRVEVYSVCSASPLFTFNGTGTDKLGSSVTGGFDVNNDGRADFAFGAPGVSGNIGSVSIRSGATGAPAIATFNGANTGENFGSSVSAISDITGDGVADWLIGAQGDGFANGGYVRIISGANNAVHATINGLASEYFGSLVSPAGDLNQDGMDDILVSSIFGTLGKLSIYLSNNLGSRFGSALSGTVSNEDFASSLAPIGDVNGDGSVEILIGAPGAGASAVGQAYVVSIDTCPGTSKLQPLQCGCAVAETDSDLDGTPNCIDACPADIGKTAPGVCGCGVADTDTDGDSTLDCNETCPNDPDKTETGACGCGTADTDSDADAVPDCNDGCPADANKTASGQCGCGSADTDSDSDGVSDCQDLCPNDPNKLDPQTCGCGSVEGDLAADTDGDGTPNCSEECDTDPDKLSAGICGCGVADIDSDGDGVLDCQDNCPSDPLKTAPGLCGCTNSDTDTSNDRDGDGEPDCTDSCPADRRKTDPGLCGCGVLESIGDADGDSIIDCLDECPSDPVTDRVCGCFVEATDCEDGEIITPETKIVRPPGAVVKQPNTTKRKSKVTISQYSFGGVQLKTRNSLHMNLATDEMQNMLRELEAQGLGGGALTLKYKTIINKFTSSGGGNSDSDSRERKRRKRNKLSRSASVSFRGLNPGNYEARGRVIIFRGDQRVSRTNLSPPQDFKIVEQE